MKYPGDYYYPPTEEEVQAWERSLDMRDEKGCEQYHREKEEWEDES